MKINLSGPLFYKENLTKPQRNIIVMNLNIFLLNNVNSFYSLKLCLYLHEIVE